MTDKGLIIAFGAVGTGKSSICRRLLGSCPEVGLRFYTSRMPRPNEIDGKDCNFISRQDFQRIDQGGLLNGWKITAILWRPRRRSIKF